MPSSPSRPRHRRRTQADVRNPRCRGRAIAARLLAEAERTATALGTPKRVWRQPSTSPKPSRCTPPPATSGSPTTLHTNTRRSAAAAPSPSLSPRPARPEWDGGELATFLAGQGLSSKDVLAPGSQYWLTRDTAGPATALGWERQDDRVLLRSVAVRPDRRGCGAARRLVEHALTDAAQGARTAYLLSTEAGPFWTRLGFRPVPVAEVAHALPNAPQVHQYRTAGTLADEAAWRRDLHAPAADHLDRHATTPGDG
ncbi:GNAT family N-acetyltransferase [Streptomyces sp. NPDC014995]|uniref:GNAT family N-acetyltransferase n=1 Tax=Streptomyces sp. NPDC014995 TaxID=3364936 RepID=UPI0036F840E2